MITISISTAFAIGCMFYGVVLAAYLWGKQSNVRDE